MNRPTSANGVLYGFLAYLLWGIFPLYFRLLEDSGAVEVVMHRIVWSLVVCVVVVSALRQWGAVQAVLRQPRTAGTLAVAAVLLALNWGVYVYAVNSGHVIEASLGYFINPLITVLLGVVLLRERLRPGQWAAIALGAVAVVVLTVDYGRPPWIAAALALSFGGYGLLKNRVGGNVGALPGLFTETLALAPVALVWLVVLAVRGDQTFTERPPLQALLLISTGLVTVIPLLLFAAAARRVPLTTIGLLQYLTPVLQLLCGVTVLDETMPLSRWIGFTLVWAALVALTVDSLRAHRADRRAALAAPEEVLVP